MLGLTLGSMFQMQALSARSAAKPTTGGPGWGKAKSIILVYLQGGLSHLDLWDPKEDVPGNVRSAFKTIPTKISGVHFTEILPRLARIKRGNIHGASDKTGSAPIEDPVHPGELLATIYHAFGIDPATMVMNHLNQPRELVKAEAVTRLFT